MKTWNDVWQYLCDKGKARNCLQYYVSNPNDNALSFWNGVLTVLETEGKVTKDDALCIWYEISKDEHLKEFYEERRK